MGSARTDAPDPVAPTASRPCRKGVQTVNALGVLRQHLLCCVLAQLIMEGGAVTFSAIGQWGLLAQLIMEGGAVALNAMGQ